MKTASALPRYGDGGNRTRVQRVQLGTCYKHSQPIMFSLNSHPANGDAIEPADDLTPPLPAWGRRHSDYHDAQSQPIGERSG